MNDRERELLWNRFKEQPEDDAVFEVARGHIEKGRTFSAAALTELEELLRLFIGARIMARWEGVGEPPTGVRVTVNVEAY